MILNRLIDLHQDVNLSDFILGISVLTVGKKSIYQANIPKMGQNGNFAHPKGKLSFYMLIKFCIWPRVKIYIIMGHLLI